MTIEKSRDTQKIRSILTHRGTYSRMVNDESPNVSEFPQELPESLNYVLVTDEEGPIAVFLICPTDPNIAEIHFCFHPRSWGSTVEISRQFLKWLWSHTDVSVAIGPIPGYNRLALKLAKAVGFEEYGRTTEAVRKRGTSYDLIYTKIERPAA